MVNTRLCHILFAAAVFSSCVFAADAEQDDDENDIAFLCSLSQDTTPAAEDRRLLPENETSDVRIFSFFMVRLYQNFVSSQQHNVCVFTPSCSRFGMASVERFGFVRGVLMTADRMERCNPNVGHGGYAFDPSNGKWRDPVEHYRAEKDQRPSPRAPADEENR